MSLGVGESTCVNNECGSYESFGACKVTEMIAAIGEACCKEFITEECEGYNNCDGSNIQICVRRTK
jgi:hypothetical protein